MSITGERDWVFAATADTGLATIAPPDSSVIGLLRAMIEQFDAG
jgi:hypothetical protein